MFPRPEDMLNPSLPLAGSYREIRRREERWRGARERILLANPASSRCLVVKNPLSPVEHKRGDGVRNEMFEMGLDKFVRGLM